MLEKKPGTFSLRAPAWLIYSIITVAITAAGGYAVIDQGVLAQPKQANAAASVTVSDDVANLVVDQLNRMEAKFDKALGPFGTVSDLSRNLDAQTRQQARTGDAVIKLQAKFDDLEERLGVLEEQRQ